MTTQPDGEMESILETITRSIDTADETSKRVLATKLRDIAISLETPNDTLHRIVYQVRSHEITTITSI